MPGFVSIDCGGTANYTDELGLRWTADAGLTTLGTAATISIPSEHRTQYSTLRYFPADGNKYCYRLKVSTRTRYLVRATFLYGNFDSSNVFPEFDLYLGASHWSAIVIYDEARVVTREMVLLAPSLTIAVCLSNATTGHPFISTLELRQLNGSLYYTAYEADYFLSLAARINFGAPNTDPVRYPDDPYDRIWESDMVRRANYLVDAAPGTTNVSTDKPVFVSSSERPPQKVMQTAVVGSLGELTYRLNLNGFPGNGWAFSYFANSSSSSPACLKSVNQQWILVKMLQGSTGCTSRAISTCPSHLSSRLRSGRPTIHLRVLSSMPLRYTNTSKLILAPQMHPSWQA